MLYELCKHSNGVSSADTTVTPHEYRSNLSTTVYTMRSQVAAPQSQHIITALAIKLSLAKLCSSDI